MGFKLNEGPDMAAPQGKTAWLRQPNQMTSARYGNNPKDNTTWFAFDRVRTTTKTVSLCVRRRRHRWIFDVLVIFLNHRHSTVVLCCPVQTEVFVFIWRAECDANDG